MLLRPTRQPCTNPRHRPTLYAASTGPVPMLLEVRAMPSGPFMITVAVGMPMLPHTTWAGGRDWVGGKARVSRGREDGLVGRCS